MAHSLLGDVGPAINPALYSYSPVGGESFSETVKRVTGGKQDIMRFAGALSFLTDEEVEEIKTSIKRMREYSSKRFREQFK